MKKYIGLVAVLISTVFLMSSCIKDDSSSSSVTYEDTAITSFTLGTVKVSRLVGKKKYAKDANGNPIDSIYTYSYTGSKTPVYIDHLSREIYNTDSLPAGSHMKMLATVTSKNSQTITYRDWDAADDASWTYYNSGDSILFGEDGGESRELRFRVLASQGGYTRDYKVTIVCHKEYADSFKYVALASQDFFKGAKSLKSTATDAGVFVLADDGTKSRLHFTLDGGDSWQTDQNTFGAGATIISSGQDVYLLSDGKIYYGNGVSGDWVMVDVATYNLKTLAGACNGELYALNNAGKMMMAKSVDGDWAEDILLDNDNLMPVKDINYAVVAQKVNGEVSRITLVGNKESYTENGDTCAMVWNKNVESGDDNGEMWIYNNPTDAKQKKVALPAMKNLSMTGYYNGWILAIGGNNLNSTAEANTAYKKIYCSEDGGTSWHKVAGLRMPKLPADSSYPVLIAADTSGYFYLISAEDGSVYRCKLNNATWDSTEEKEYK